jgi:glutathione synthase/RimK-type ligase-like ATP-grasp enzyme
MLHPKRRTINDAIIKVCKETGIDCTVTSDDWVMQLTRGTKSHLIYGYAFDINNQASAAIAFDKVATYALLYCSEIPAVEHFLLTDISRPNIQPSYIEQLLMSYPELVIKPLIGGSGNQFGRYHTSKAILDHTQKYPVSSWAASPYLPIEREIRFVVYDGSIAFAYEKLAAPIMNGLKMFKLSAGAQPSDFTLDSSTLVLQTLVLNAIAAIGLRLGAVDIAIDKANTSRVLEINCSFSLERYAQSSSEHMRTTIKFYEQIIGDLFV